MKKIYSLLLMLLMAVMSTNTAKAELIYDGGSWTIEQGSSFLNSSTVICLNIKNASVCKDYSSPSATPWAAWKDDIEEIFFRFDGNNFRVGTHMFAQMPKLQGVWRWNGNCMIMAYAFQNCPKLEVCQILMDATHVGDNSFQDCKSLKVAQFDNVGTIGNYAFAGCTSLQRMECFSGVVEFTVGKYAFKDCENLEKVDLEKAQWIDNYAFENCFDLLDVYLKKCTRVGKYAFRNCMLPSVHIGEYISTIDDYAFAAGIKKNGHLTIDSYSIPTMGTNVFANVDCSTITLHLPDNYDARYDYSPWDCFLRDLVPVDPSVPDLCEVFGLGSYDFVTCQWDDSQFGVDNMLSLVFYTEEGWYISETEGLVMGSDNGTLLLLTIYPDKLTDLRGIHPANDDCRLMEVSGGSSSVTKAVDGDIIISVDDEGESYTIVYSLTMNDNNTISGVITGVCADKLPSSNDEAIESVQSSAVGGQKMIREGQLLIEYNGKTYNAQGVEIK